MIYLQGLAGLLVLLLGGDIVVRGAVSMAERLGVPPLVIGLSVVAFGTSAPELVVCVDAVLNNLPSVAVGNVIGSNIANVLLVLGLSAFVYPIVCDPDGMRKNGVLMVAASMLFIVFAWGEVLVRWQGFVLFVLLVAFLVSSYARSMRSGDRAAETYSHEYEGIEAMPRTLGISITFIVLGCACLVIGANWFIGGAVGVARSLGVSEAVIGLTLVALGTSLPELATSLVAAARREGEMAIGNVLGSNIFNIFGIMGVTAMVAPVAVPAEVLAFDIWVMLGVALLLGTLTWHGARIGRGLGLGLFIAYAAYVALQFQGLSA